MLSPAERKYLEIRKAKGKRITNGTILLSDRYYSKNYQKVLYHRILKKWIQAENDIYLCRQHEDLYNNIRNLQYTAMQLEWKEKDEKKKARNKHYDTLSKREKELLWELEQIELEKKRDWIPKIELSKKKKPDFHLWYND